MYRKVPRVRSPARRAPAALAGESKKDSTIYTGRTDDLKQRIGEHNGGKVKSTKYKLPALLIYYEAYINKQDAIDRELYLKTGDGRREVRKQLKNLLGENNNLSRERRGVRVV